MKTRFIRTGAVAMFALLLTATASAFTAPSNDDFDNASVISTLPFTTTLDTTAATVAADDPFCAGRGATVWYAFTPSTNTTIDANTFGSNYDTTLSVWTGSRGALNLVTCNDDFGGLQSRVSFTATAGVTYYFMVSSFGGEPGGNLVFTVNQVVPPANDDFNNPTVVSSLPFTTTEDTHTATVAADDPFCAGRGATVWFAFTPTENMRIEANTFGSNYDTTLSVWTGPRGSLNLVACNDDSQGPQSRVFFNATAGVTYYFMVSSFAGGTGGNLVFNVLQAPPPLAISIAVDHFGTVDPITGAATISGTATCNRPTFIFINGQVKRNLGTNVLNGFFFAFVSCDGSGTWNTQVFSSPARSHGRSLAIFVPGKADVTASGFAFDPEEGDFAQSNITTSVVLQGTRQ